MIQNKFYFKRYLSYGSNNFELSSKWNQFVFDHNIFVDEQYFKSILVPFKSFIDKNQSLNFSIMFSIKLVDGTIRSISKVKNVNYSTDLDSICNYFYGNRTKIYSHYKSLLISKYLLVYKTSDVKPDTINHVEPLNIKLSSDFLNSLPPQLLFNSSDQIGSTYPLKHFDDELILKLVSFDSKSYTVNVIFNNTVLATFQDKILSRGFYRLLNSKTLFILDNVIISETTNKSCKYISKLTKVQKFNDKILTMDIETKVVNNEHIPIAIGLFNPSFGFKYFTIDDAPNFIDLAIMFLMNKSFSGYHIYLHNFSRFDSAFLIPRLVKFGEIQPCLRDSKIIFLEFLFQLPEDNNHVYKITFNDSYLILPHSLRKLCVSFELNIKKYYFPFSFLNQISHINYVGETPAREHFNDIPEDVYNSLPNPYNLKDELIKYLEIDCESLFNILKLFFEDLFNDYEIDILKYPTISSIAMAVYRTCYLDDYKIPIITEGLFKDISQAYYGGVVEVYKTKGNNLNQYDVNSLYPFAMLGKMPTGIIKHIKYFKPKNLQKLNLFGFFYCNIDTGAAKFPVLTIKKDGKLISPLGSWSGWYYSEELYAAIDQGYKIDILEGYCFEHSKPFEKFVRDFYNIKKNSNDKIKRNIAKLLLNSLYGRFGMNYELSSFKVIKIEELDQYLNKEPKVEEIINDELQLISFNDNKQSRTVSIAIAAATTGKARVHMNNFKVKYFNDLYYSDTDSLVISSYLKTEYVGDDIGKLKLEYKDFEGVYLSPKVYSMKFKDGSEITKIKGINVQNQPNINYENLCKLLNPNNTIKLNNLIFKYNLRKGTIEMKNQEFNLKSVLNKREPIYKDKEIVETIPLKMND
jgi:hypothetical protein